MKGLARVLSGALLWALPAQAQPLVLTLEAAQARALRDNHALHLVASQIDEANALNLQAKAAFLPQVQFSEQVLRSDDAVTTFGLRLRQERFTQAGFALNALNQPVALTDYQTSLEVRQSLFAGGADRARHRQAQAGVEGAVLTGAERCQEVRWQVAEAYWDLVLAGQSLEALRQSLASARAHAAAAQARYQQQTSPYAEVLAAQSRVAQLEGDEVAAASQELTAAEQLSLVLGLDSQVQIIPADTLAPVAVTLSAAELEQAALEHRPGLRAAAQEVEAAHQGMHQARAGHLPLVQAFARFDLDSNSPFTRQGESWTLGGVLSWELFSGFRTTAALRQARARQHQAQLRQEQLAQQVRRQVRQACRRVETAQLRIGAAAQAHQYAQERLRLADLHYGQGLIATAELLDAEDQHTQARLRYLETLRQLRAGLAYLEYAANQPLTQE
ncbi:MAG: TolC family protein [Candidatus Latescibacteria bacterium]|nr:TolC family protein [Candidatus Latescibacterota bacterium]